MSVSQIQIRQCEHDIQFCSLFSQTSVSCFSIPENVFHYRKNVLDFAANRWFLMFSFLSGILTTWRKFFDWRGASVDDIFDVLAIFVFLDCILAFLCSSALSIDMTPKRKSPNRYGIIKVEVLWSGAKRNGKGLQLSALAKSFSRSNWMGLFLPNVRIVLLLLQIKCCASLRLNSLRLLKCSQS
jgi:hypothetical protein